MLPPQHRLRSSDDFRRAVRSGKRAGGRYVVLHVFKESTRGPRVGFVVSKAIGNAVTRNRVKRRMRHAVADLLPKLTATPDLVVRALPRSQAASFHDLHRDIAKGLQRIGVI